MLLVRILLFIVMANFLVSCAVPEKNSLGRRNLEEFFIGNGVTRYFLSNLPNWANRSASGQCLRSTPSQFFNMEKLRNSFALSYEEAHQLQLMFNVELRKKRREAKATRLSFQEEEQIFFQVSDKVLAGVRIFRPPKYKRIHLIWIDALLQKKGGSSRLKNLMNSSLMEKGHPVLVSFCLSHDELKSYLRQENMEGANIRLISYELLSPYSKNRKLLAYDFLDFDSLFKPSQKLHLFLPKVKRSIEFKGRFTIHKY